MIPENPLQDFIYCSIPDLYHDPTVQVDIPGLDHYGIIIFPLQQLYGLLHRPSEIHCYVLRDCRQCT